MTTITLDNIGKRYGRDWIFRKVNYHFTQGKSYAILGPNGSGKSTLMQLIAYNQSPSEGLVKFSDNNKSIEADDVFQHISICAPYLQLIEEFTLAEQLRFHFSFKKAIDGISDNEIMALLGLQKHEHKQIRHFSSGMKQRVKLATSVFSDVPVVLLDEPATNLDAQGVAWYQELLEKYQKGRILIISSNRLEEYEMCGEKMNISEFR